MGKFRRTRAIYFYAQCWRWFVVNIFSLKALLNFVENAMKKLAVTDITAYYCELFSLSVTILLFHTCAKEVNIEISNWTIIGLFSIFRGRAYVLTGEKAISPSPLFTTYASMRTSISPGARKSDDVDVIEIFGNKNTEIVSYLSTDF